MYFSVLPLNPAFPQVQADIRDANMLFKRVRSLFGHRPADTRELFRIWYNADCAPFLLVLSPTPCHLTALPLHYLRADMVQRELADVLAHLQVGQTHTFDLLASVTVRKDNHEYALRTDAERIQWLQRKGAQHGFAVVNHTDPALSLQCVQSTHLSAQKGQQRQVHLAPGHYTGQLCITDVAVFVDALCGGIGRSKALGLGLLWLPEWYLPADMQHGESHP